MIENPESLILTIILHNNLFYAITNIIITKYCAWGENLKCALIYFNLLKKKYKTEHFLLTQYKLRVFLIIIKVLINCVITNNFLKYEINIKLF